MLCCSHEAVLPHALIEVQFDEGSQLLEEGVSLRPSDAACSLRAGILVTQLRGLLTHWGGGGKQERYNHW